MPGVPAAADENAVRDELMAAGANLEAAGAEIKWWDDCFASYVVPKS